jgi:DNA transposition AAA+ family ATPase
MQKYNELEQRASLIAELDAELDPIRKLEARDRIHSAIEEMKEEGKALVLTDEEERILRAFRRFKNGCKPGGVFKWQTRPVETGLVRDPQEAWQEYRRHEAAARKLINQLKKTVRP